MRHEMNRVFADDDRDRRSCPARRYPIAPADDEAGVVAECMSHENVLTARSRHERAEFRERIGAEECVKAADDPYREKRPERRQTRGDVAGRAQNAGRDRVADDHGQTKSQTEDGKKTAACWTRHTHSVKD